MPFSTILHLSMIKTLLDYHTDSLGNLYNLLAIDNIWVIFWRMGNILLINMINKPGRGYCNGRYILLDENTVVFNNLIEVKSDLDDNWEVPLSRSWHKQWLPIA